MTSTEVAKWIQDVGMSPGELADELGLPRGQISRLIVGEEEPDRLTRWALAGLRDARRHTRLPQPQEFAKQEPTSPLANELSDDKWTGQTARLALPILVEVAESGERRTITYTELHGKVVGRGGKPEIGKLTKYAFPLGRIARAMERLDVPPLTSIVVKASTRLPSSGIDEFVVTHLNLTRENAKALRHNDKVRREYVEHLWREVFGYKKWREVMATLGITGDPAYDI